jgi:hypothetical protein
MTRDQLVACLKRAGELQISGEDQPELDSHFDTIHFRFHGPDGFEADYSGLSNVAEGNDVACQTWIEGTLSVSSPSHRLPLYLPMANASSGTY